MSEFIKEVNLLPLHKLPNHLSSFPIRWPFPRGDLYHWIPVLDRFDTILEVFTREYAMVDQPQAVPFGRRLLLRDTEYGPSEPAGRPSPPTPEELDHIGFTEEGDRELVDQILYFTRVLLENCGNRSLYASSYHLSNLINSTSLCLIKTTLRLALRLAQRYHASRMRLPSLSQQDSRLLNSHYNINLDKIHKLSMPFTLSMPSESSTNESSKGKEKVSTTTEHVQSHGFADLVSIVKAQGMDQQELDELSSVWLSYYGTATDSPDVEESNQRNDDVLTSGRAPQGPPVRRSSNLGPQSTSRQARPSSSDEQANNPFVGSTSRPVDPSRVSGLKSLHIPSATVCSTPPHELIQSYLSEIPRESHYDLLTKIRIAHAVRLSRADREDIVAVRLLAVANLAYIHPESTFQQKVAQQDSDQPRQLQLASQLAELVHPPRDGDGKVSRQLQVLALYTLEALSKHKSKALDVSVALNVNVNHGVLFYILRKAAADLSETDLGSLDLEDWQDALFSLLMSLPTSPPRTGEAMIVAGLLDILIGMLKVRTDQARRVFPKILNFLDAHIYSIRDAFQALVNAEGLDAIANVFAFEVDSADKLVKKGEGLPIRYRTPVTDFQIPFYHQQTLRWLMKFINHTLTHGSGGFDRPIRNLVSGAHLLDGLRTIIANGGVFGSSIWSGAVNIMSSFIHNEPTSYSIIAEAGLSNTFLESITQEHIPIATVSPTTQTFRENGVEGTTTPGLSTPQNEAAAQTPLQLIRPRDRPLARGILPAAESLQILPQAFGAICLVESGMRLFQSSEALQSFFEIFESADHVKAMKSETDMPILLGNLFDEFVRHHPQLRNAVMDAVLEMVRRVNIICFNRASSKGVGAKLWVEGENGEVRVAGGRTALLGPEGPLHQEYSAKAKLSEPSADVEMPDVDAKLQDDKTNSAQSMEGVIEAEDANESPTTMDYVNVASRFLHGFFQNHGLCAAFIERGGVEDTLDMVTLPCWNYNFKEETRTSEWVSQAIQALCEQKPHLVLPSLLKRLDSAIERLEPFINYKGSSSYFSHFTTLHPSPKLQADLPADFFDKGTQIVKALVVVNMICFILGKTFQSQIYNQRSTSNAFSQVNLADIYHRMIDGLGRLRRRATWEELMLQDHLSPAWKEATRISSSGFGNEEADDIMGIVQSDRASAGRANGTAPTPNPSNHDFSLPGAGELTMPTLGSDGDKSVAQFKNVQTVRYLLSQTPTAVTLFFQGLGKMLLSKRNIDSYQKQNAYMVADQLAKVTLDELQFSKANDAHTLTIRYAYWIIVLTSLSQLLVETPAERPYPHTVTLVLQSFKTQGGFVVLGNMLETLLQEVRTVIASQETQKLHGEAECLMNVALAGIKIILGLFSQVIHPKCVGEASQTTAMTSRGERDRERADYFSPAQFLVEIRMAVLPSVEQLWNSEEIMEHATTSIVKTVVEVMRTILEGDAEHGALKHSDRVPAPVKPPHKHWKPRNPEHITRLMSEGFDEDLVREAFYRCFDNYNAAKEYCSTQRTNRRSSRNPIPKYDIPPQPKPDVSSAPIDQIPIPVSETEQAETISPNDVGNAAEPRTRPIDIMQDALDEADNTSTPTWPPALPFLPGEAPSLPMDVSLSLDFGANNVQDEHIAPSTTQEKGVEAAKLSGVITVDDLDSKRSHLRKTLIDRILDVLNVHDDVSFELSDLIFAAISKAGDPIAIREEIGETIVQSLISLQPGDDRNPQDKKIAAYAHLLAILLQDRDFCNAALEELKGSFAILVDLIRAYPTENAEDSRWDRIAKILLIIEKLLAEDTQPHQIQWTPPSVDNPLEEKPITGLPEPVVSQSQKIVLFDGLLAVMPYICSDESLALAVVRVLVILTRNRQVALRLGEKKSIQKLFLMVKQLSGISNERLQSALMVVLRHVVEDDEAIRTIMRSEIQAMFEGRQQRQIDTTSYTRQMYHLVLRAPDIFVEVTNEKLELARFDANQRPQVLVLKKAKTKDDEKQIPDKDASQGVDENKAGDVDVRAANSVTDSNEEQDLNQSKVSGLKPPVVENPDGVIHYLLCELLSYKDVSDKDTPEPPKSTKDSTTLEVGNLAGESASMSIPPSPTDQEPKSAWKREFKVVQHPIYIYRCFILQCLTELLACYNRTKIDFINFSRKADPHITTPSKPRSRVLDYLLTTLIPVGTLNHVDDLAFRKRQSTSNWAISVVVSLCSKTGERGFVKDRDIKDAEDEPELLFVRKFVLEHALKAFKDANVSGEPLDHKYSRLLCLSDLFNRMLTGKPNSGNNNFSVEMLMASQKQLAKIMFEKNYISAFTGALADMDLNFPGAKRAVKYILRPFKLLTQAALELGASFDVSTFPGATTEEDMISTASSVSEMDDSREQTPDLFRHSTLGIFGPRRDGESESDEEDEDDDDDEDDEEFEDEYGAEMEYDEADPDEDDNVSDDDEEIEGIGPIEGLPGNVDVEVVIEGEGEDYSGSEGNDSDGMSDLENEDDEDDEMDMLEEVTGDDENASLAGDEDDVWESADENGEEYLGEDDIGDNRSSPHGDPMEQIVRVLEDAGPPLLLGRLEDDGPQLLIGRLGGDLEMNMEQDDYLEDEVPDEDGEDHRGNNGSVS